MRYLLFLWGCYEPRGGANDLARAYASVEDAISAFDALKPSFGRFGVCGQIFDVEASKVISEYASDHWEALP